MSNRDLRATTVLAVRRDGVTAMGGDGQVTLGDTVIKATAKRIFSFAKLPPLSKSPVRRSFPRR